MKTLKIILSLLIISITIIVIYELANGLNFNFLEYLDEKYHFLFLTLLTQIFGVYFSSKRWKNCVESYNEGKNILFTFHTYFFLNARANIINNFLPSIFGHEDPRLVCGFAAEISTLGLSTLFVPTAAVLENLVDAKRATEEGPPTMNAIDARV